jgi:hypothetical protein
MECTEYYINFIKFQKNRNFLIVGYSLEPISIQKMEKLNKKILKI